MAAVDEGAAPNPFVSLLGRSGIQRRAHVRKLTDGDVLEVIDRSSIGRMSLRKIGKEFGVDSETIRKELVRRGVKIRQPGRQRRQPPGR